MKTFFKKIFKTGTSLVLGTGILLGVSGMFNQCINRGEYFEDSYHSKTLPNGIMGSTRFIKYNPNKHFQKITVKKDYGLLGGTVQIEDGGEYGYPDGLADKIKINKEISYVLATREESYIQLKKEFDEADRILKEETKRFKPYFE